MAVRAFSGTSWIRFPGINVGGDYTFAALVKMMDTTVPSGWQALSSTVDASTHSQLTHYVRGTVGSTAPQQGVPLLDNTQAATGITGVTKAITNPATWKILVVTKTAGATVPRFHVFPIGGAWTQEAGDAAVIGPATQAGGKFYVGAYADPGTAALGDFCNMRLALYAVWNGTALSDAQVQALSSGLATSAWTGHAVAPTSVWQFAQASTATAVADLVGSNTQDAITGTSVVTTDDPAGWTFAGAGSSASGSFSTHGGGDSVAVGRKGALRAVTTTGGGDSTAVGTAANVRSGTLATHGGGDSTAVGRKDAVASHDEASALPPFTVQVTGTVTRGGGDSTAVGVASGVDNRNGSFATHAGGDSTATGVKGALRATATTTGGGDSTAAGTKAVQRTLSTTGGGDSTASGTAGQASTGSLATHGGGDSTATGVKTAARAAATTGGGDSTAAGVKAVQRSFATTGGGDSTGSGTSVAGPSGRVQCTGGGATTFSGKRATVASLGCTAGGHLTSSGRKATSRAVGCTGNGQTRLLGINGVLVPVIYRTGHSGRILSGMTGRASHHT